MNGQYISDDELARLNVSRESLLKIETYVDLLLTWQSQDKPDRAFDNRDGMAAPCSGRTAAAAIAACQNRSYR